MILPTLMYRLDLYYCIIEIPNITKLDFQSNKSHFNIRVHLQKQ